jgi:hypothetical protein
MTAPKPRDFGVAIGTVIYEALILAVAMQVRGTRHSRQRVPGLEWSEAQIAIDVILLKVRLLEEFLFSNGTKKDDMFASQFPIAYAPPSSLALPAKVRHAINKRTAHLSWMRVADDPPPPFTAVGEGIEVYAQRILKEIYTFIAVAFAHGITPTRKTHQEYWEALEKLYAELIV